MAQKALGRREYLSEQKDPSDDLVRVVMFLDLAADYANLVRTMPMPEGVSWGSAPMPDSERWAVVLHGTLLRKFFTDQVEIAKVVPAVRRLLRDDADPELMQALTTIEEHASAHDAPVFMQLQVGEQRITAWEAAQIQLHGRHVHADFAKWRASVELPFGQPQYLQMWAVAAADVVRPLVVNIRWAWDQGQFMPDVDLEHWTAPSAWGEEEVRDPRPSTRPPAPSSRSTGTSASRRQR